MQGKESDYSDFGYGGCGGGAAQTPKEWGEVLLDTGEIAWITNSTREQSLLLMDQIERGGFRDHERIPVSKTVDGGYKFVKPNQIICLL